MFTVKQRKILKQRKIFSKLENKKIKTYFLKGGRKISVKEPYSLKRDKKKKIVYVFCGGKEISFFDENVAVVTIERYISGHKFSLQRQRKQKEKERIEKTWWLKEYCETNWSSCKTADFNCNKCKSSHKEWALERKKKGKKIVKPRKKKNFIKIIEERNASLKQAALKNKEDKEIIFDRDHTGGW